MNVFGKQVVGISKIDLNESIVYIIGMGGFVV